MAAVKRHPPTPQGDARAILLMALDTAFDKQSWHGANLTSAIRGVDATTARRAPARGRKSVWQQVLHAAYWKHRVINRLAGATSFPRRGSNWPTIPSPANASAWKADVELLRDLHRRLRDIVSTLPAKKLTPKTTWLIQGAAAHDLYHAGQIKLLRRLLEQARRTSACYGSRMPSPLDRWFDAGVLIRPTADRPDLVHLTRALATLCGASGLDDSPPVRALMDLIGRSDHYVFVLLDGLGMNIVRALPDDCFLRRSLRTQIYSTFPSTTAVALTAVATADWPSRHGVTGWFTHFPDREFSAMILPFAERVTSTPLAQRGIRPEDLLPLPSVLSRFKTHEPLTLSPSYIANSVYNVYSRGGTCGTGYNTIEAAVDLALARIDNARDARTYTYLYLHDIDTLCHHVGVTHDAVAPLVLEIDAQLSRLATRLAGRGRLVVTADHGLIDVPAPDQALLESNDPTLEFLSVPPTGDARMPIFHVRPGRRDAFADYFQERFGDRVALLSIDDAESMRLFGPTEISPLVRRRFGDFVGIPFRPATVAYHPPAKPRGSVYVAVHGGLSPDEMIVPLCLA